MYASVVSNPTLKGDTMKLFIQTVTDGRMYALESKRTGNVLLLRVICHNGSTRVPAKHELVAWLDSSR